MEDKGNTKKAEPNSCGSQLVALFGLVIVGVFVLHSMRTLGPILLDIETPTTNEVNATAAARTMKSTQRAKTTATAEACYYRQTRKWCQARRKWSADSEAKLSALLKSVGGLDALTAKEQERVQEIEHGLAQYRRICEGGGLEANIGSILQEISMSFQERMGEGEIERELARYRSRC